MKNFRKRIYLLGIGIVIMLSALMMFGNINKVSAAPSSVKVEYKIYDATKYDAYLADVAKWSEWDTDFERWLKKAVDSDCIDDAEDYNADGVFNMQDVYEYMADEGLTFDAVMTGISAADTNWAKHKANGNATWQATASTDPTVSCYDFYGLYPHEILGNDYKGTITINPAPVKTEFKEKEEIVIEPFVTVTGDTQNGAYIYFDPSEFANSTYTPVFYHSRTSDNPAAKVQGGLINLGWGFNVDNLSGHIYASGTTVSVGAVKLKIKDGISADTYDISITTAGSYTSGVSVYYGSDNIKLSYDGSNFNEEKGEIVIESTGNATNLKSTTINGTTFNGSSSPSISDITSGASTGIKATTSIDISAAVAGGGTVTGVKFGTSSGDVSYTATDNTATTGNYSCDISDNDDFEPGSKIYVTVYTQSGDTHNTGSYVLIVEKAKLSTAILEDITITYGTSRTAVTMTPAFASGTYIYTIKAPTNEALYVTPIYDQTNNYRQECYVNNSTSSTASGTEVTIPGTLTTLFKVVMESQDDSKTQPYTFNITRLSDDKVLTNLTCTPTSGSAITATYDSTAKSYTVTGIKFAKNGFTLKPTLKSGQTASISTDGGTTYTSLSASGSAYTFTVDPANKYAAITENFKLKVTSALGNPEIYDVSVTRDKANEDKSFAKIEVLYTDNGVPKTVQATQQSDGSYLVDNVPFKVTQYQIKTTLSTTNADVQKWSTDNGTTKLASAATTSNITFMAQGSDGGDESISSTNIRIIAENQDMYDDIVLNVKRKEADRNLNFASVSILDNNSTSLGTFNSTTQEFTINPAITKLSSLLTGLTAQVVLPTNSLSQAYIGSKNAAGNDRTTLAVRTSLNEPFNSDNTTEDTIEFTIKLVNELGVSSTPIVVSFTRAKADDTATINILAEADIEQEATHTKELSVASAGGNYSVTAEYETSSVDFTIECTDTSITTTEIYINNTLYTGTTYTYTFPANVKNAITGLYFEVEVYTAAHPRSVLPHTPSKTYKIYVNRAAAEDDHAFTRLNLTDISGTILSPSATDSTASKYVYKGIDISEGAFSSGKFKIDAEAHSTKAKLYWSDTADDFKQHEYSSSTEFDVGLFPSGDEIYISCFSQFGNKTTVTIKTISSDDRDTDNKISNITIAESSDFTFSDSIYDYTTEVVVPFTTTEVNFTITKNSLLSTLCYKEDGQTVGDALRGKDQQTVNIKTSTLTAGSTLVCEFVAKSESEVDGHTYTIRIKRTAGQTGQYLESLKINGINAYGGVNDNILNEYDKNSNMIDFVMTNTSTSAKVDFTVSSKASYTLTNITKGVTSTDNPYNFAVTSGSYTELEFKIQSEKNSIESPTTFNVVTIRVYSANKNATLSDLELFKADGESLATDVDENLFTFDNTVLDQGTFTAPFSIGDAVVLTATAADSDATITGDGNKSIAAGATIKYKVLVKSQYATLNTSLSSSFLTANGLQKEYVVQVKRNKASNVCTLDELVIKDTAGNDITLDPGFTKENGVYKVENLADSITIVNVSYKKTDSNSKVVGPSGDVELNLPSASTEKKEFDVTIIVYAEDTNYSKKYVVTFSRTQIVLDGVFDIDKIVVVDGAANTYAEFNTVKYQYDVTLPATQSGVTFNVALKSIKASIVDESDNTLNSPFLVELEEGETKTVTIVGKAQNGDKGTPYVYTINRLAKDTDATLKSLTYNGIAVSDFASAKEDYSINLTHDIETFKLVGETTKTTSTITSNDAEEAINLVDGINGPFKITVVAENTNFTKVYSVTVIRDASSELSDLFARNKAGNELEDSEGNKLLDFDKTKFVYTFSVPYETDIVNLDAIAEGGNLVKITGNGEQSLVEGLNELLIKVTPASGLNAIEYHVNITRGVGDSDNTIKTFKYYASLKDKNNINETTLEPAPILTTLNVNLTDTEYSYRVARDITVFEPIIELNSPDTSSITMPSNTVINVGQKNTFEVVVQNQKGEPRKYTFIVYNADDNSNIKDINLKTSMTGSELVDGDNKLLLDFNKDSNIYNPSVSYSNSEVYLEVLIDSTYSSIRYSKDGINYSDYASQKVELDKGDNKFYFYGISEYGKLVNDGKTGRSKVYSVTITRNEANADPTLKELIITVGDKQYTWDSTIDDAQTLGTSEKYTFTVADIGETATSLNIKAAPNDSRTAISGQTGNQTLSDLAVTGGQPSGYIFSFVINSTAEDGSKNEYTVTVSRGALELDKDNSITGIAVLDSLTNPYLDFDQTKTQYDVVIPYSIDGVKVTSYTINAEKMIVSPASITGAGSFAVNVTSTDYTKTHKVFATSGAGVKGTEYIINVTIKAPASEKRLEKLLVSGEELTNFDSDVFNYVYGTVDNNTSVIDVSAIAKDAKAVVSGDVGTDIPLELGPNTFTIRVTAENGDYSNYKLVITRDYPSPYLIDLGATGIKLLDTTDKETDFESDVTTYHSTVSFLTASATITAQVDVESHEVSCSNSVPISTTGTNRSFNVTLNEGVNEFSVKVKSKRGKAKTYKYIISRRSEESANTAISSLSVEGVEDSVYYLKEKDYSNLVTEYELEVPNKVRNLDLAVVPEKIADATGDGAKVTIVNDKNLKVGKNDVYVLVTAEDGSTTRSVVITVTRDPYDFDISINEIADFAADYEANISDTKQYQVNSNVSTLNFIVKNADATDTQQPKVTVLSGDTLKVGENTVVVQIETADGNLTTETVKVTRAPMEFTVLENNTKDPNYKCVAKTNSENTYTIDLGKDGKAKNITDYTAYISFDKEKNDLEVINLTDTSKDDCSEVILQVKTKDGAESKLVHIELTSTKSPAASFDLYVWIILGLAIAILITILICVNRDKYGSVSRKRKTM